MNLSWKKYGLILRPNKNLWWMQSHAMMPTLMHMHGSKYKIFFASRNKLNQSHIGYAVIDLEHPTKNIEYSNDPVLRPGRLGAFDDNGVLASCILKERDEIFLYYVGFKPGGTTRMDLFGGLAISEDSGITFNRWSEAPIIERTKINPFINTAPWVLRDGNKYRMYFVAGCEWLHKDLPRYKIQIATSLDGKVWHQTGQTAVDFENNENALARPYVTYENRIFSMWFSSKGTAYSVKNAFSKDGIIWQRRSVGHGLSSSIPGVDDEMVCYPVVIKYKDSYYMFYNGNQYGRDGICLAVAETKGNFE